MKENEPSGDGMDRMEMEGRKEEGMKEWKGNGQTREEGRNGRKEGRMELELKDKDG